MSEKELSQDADVVEIISDDDIRQPFIKTCRNLILFDRVYENMISDLVSMAKEANDSRKIPKTFVEVLLKKSITESLERDTFRKLSQSEVGESFLSGFKNWSSYSGSSPFLKSVEEWIRVVHKDKSDTLFVVVTFFFEKILPDYYSSLESGEKFEGRIEPMRIGRRKDFWNRLTIAYRDLFSTRCSI